jgi:hypothetical protein
MALAPEKLTIRCYGVGFGDCFLLTFDYPGGAASRHMLIDFGSMQRPPNAASNLMGKIAADIAKTVGKRLQVLVATHRHGDHISGFETSAGGKGTGAVIAKLKPQLVIQPWTEKLDAPRDWKGPGKGLTPAADDALRLTLDRMSEVAAMSVREARHQSRQLRAELGFVAQDGVKNLSAVKNLAKWGKQGKAAYVFYGKKIPGIATLLPGVRIDVLGPPTISQKSDVKPQNPRNEQEYWHFTRFWSLQGATAGLVTTAGADLFPRAPVYDAESTPAENRWFIRRLRAMRGEQLLRIVRAMDSAMNNTSVILLITVGKKKFLFPGDAQWENWEHTLGKDLKKLEGVDVYKVGHHGSLNATPMTLWKNFGKKSTKKTAPGRLQTLMSTRTDSMHGHPENDTEVPRERLVRALQRHTTLRSTQELEAEGGLVLPLEFSLG